MQRSDRESAGSRGASVRPLWRVELPDSAARAAWSSDGRVLTVATLAGPVLFFDTKTRVEGEKGGRLFYESEGHPGGALAVAFCPRSPLVATGGQDGQVQLFVPGEGGRSARIHVGSAPVAHIAWSPDGDIFAAASGRSVRFYSRGGELEGEYADHASTVTSLCWSDVCGGWISACYGGVHVLSRASLRCERLLFARTSILAAIPSPCGRYLAAGAQDPVVRLWDLAGDGEAIHLEGYRDKIATLLWSSDTPVLGTASGASVVLWSFAGGDFYEAPHVELQGHTRRVNALCFFPGGRAVATGAADGYLRLFDLTQGLAPAQEINTGAPVHLIELSPAKDMVITAGRGGSLRAWGLSAPRAAVAERLPRARAERCASS